MVVHTSEPEKNNGPSGVIPIAVLKEESIVEVLLTCIWLLLIGTYFLNVFGILRHIQIY
jgi:hypothetical protein